MSEIEDTTIPVALTKGTADHAAIQIASLASEPRPTVGEMSRIIQEAITTSLAQSDAHRQKLVALLRAVLARPEAFAEGQSGRASVERFLDDSDTTLATLADLVDT